MVMYIIKFKTTKTMENLTYVFCTNCYQAFIEDNDSIITECKNCNTDDYLMELDNIYELVWKFNQIIGELNNLNNNFDEQHISSVMYGVDNKQ